jgi:hypothetical protein
MKRARPSRSGCNPGVPLSVSRSLGCCAENMKLILIVLLVASSVACSAEDKNKPITISPLLSTEFGKLIEIEGKIVDDTDTRHRADLGKKLLEVHRVGTVELKQPVVMELMVFGFTDIEIPARGTIVRFRGYETGGFTGIPRAAFEDIPSVSTTDHHFEVRFQITKLLPKIQSEQAAPSKGK